VAHDRTTAADSTLPMHVTLTTDHVTVDAADPLAAALHAAAVTVERHTFLPARDDVHPWGVLLLAAPGSPLPLARLAPAPGPACRPRDGPAWRRLDPRCCPRDRAAPGTGHASTQSRRRLRLRQGSRSYRHNKCA